MTASITSLDPHPNRRFLLRFGAENGLPPRLEVRNASLELLGNCGLHEHETIYRLLGTTAKTTKLQPLLAALPIGRITIIEI